MQDIISTLKNALQQAEAGLEVAVGRLAKDGTERGDFKPSEVLALACVREALATPVTCLHQIQEPAAAEQAAWHAGLDEGRAQATGSVSNATSQPAPAAVTATASPTFMTADQGRDWAWNNVREYVGTEGWTVMDSVNFHGFFLYGWNYRGQYELQRTAAVAAVKQELTAAPVAAGKREDMQDMVSKALTTAWQLGQTFWRQADSVRHTQHVKSEQTERDFEALIESTRAALAATPAAAQVVDQISANLIDKTRSPETVIDKAAAPVVLPQPVATLHCNDECYVWARASEAGQRMRFEQPIALFTEQQLRALLATATGLPAQAVPAFCHVASLKLKSLQERGYQITGYALEKPVEGEQPERGFINHGSFVGWWWDGQSPQAQADAQDAQLLAFAVSEIRRDEMTDSALLDAMEQNRIAVVPEYEGPWDAEIYNDEGKPNHRGSGSTPREAIRAAIAAQAAQGGE